MSDSFIHSSANHFASPILIPRAISSTTEDPETDTHSVVSFKGSLHNRLAMIGLHLRLWAPWLTAEESAAASIEQIFSWLWQAMVPDCCCMLFGCHTMPHRFVQKWGIRCRRPQPIPTPKLMKLAIFTGNMITIADVNRWILGYPIFGDPHFAQAFGFASLKA